MAAARFTLGGDLGVAVEVAGLAVRRQRRDAGQTVMRGGIGERHQPAEAVAADDDRLEAVGLEPRHRLVDVGKALIQRLVIDAPRRPAHLRRLDAVAGLVEHPGHADELGRRSGLAVEQHETDALKGGGRPRGKGQGERQQNQNDHRERISAPSAPGIRRDGATMRPRTIGSVRIGWAQSRRYGHGDEPVPGACQTDLHSLPSPGFERVDVRAGLFRPSTRQCTTASRRPLPAPISASRPSMPRWTAAASCDRAARPPATIASWRRQRQCR